MPAAANKPTIRVKQLPAYEPELAAYGLERINGEIVPINPCMDVDPAKIMRDDRYRVNARLWEGRFDPRTGRLTEHRLTPILTKDKIDGRYRQLRESVKLNESDWFSMGGWGYGAHESALTANYVPAMPGPATRQQYWADYWASSAKCFEASTHSGIGRRACEAMVNFPLARGVQWKIVDQSAQDAWELFWEQNNMGERIRSILYCLSIFGEQFIRYFPGTPEQGWLIVRQLDPATIYEIVTDQEDLETVFFYHQQFQTRMELYSPPPANKAPEGPTKPGVTTYIIRQIPADEIDHVKIHTVSGEARGRGDLFPILADLKRMRDLLTSKVVQSDLATRMFMLIQGNGTQANLNAVLNAFFPGGQPPAPGTAVAINEQVQITPMQFDASKEVREDFTYQELIDSIVAGTGVSRSALGLSPAQSSGTTQATALTAETAPGKVFEDRQLICDRLLHRMFRRVMIAAGLKPDIEVEFIFPELAKEDRTAKLQDLAYAEGMGWLAKQTTASSAAGELGLTNYDFDEEQKLIAAEFENAQDRNGKDEMGNDKPAQGDGKIRRPLILAAMRQEPKLDPTKAQSQDDEPPGVLVGPGGAQTVAQNVAGAGPGVQQKTVGGMPASKVAGTQNKPQKAREALVEPGAHIRRTPDDPEFTEHADEYAHKTEENLKALLSSMK